MIINGTWRTSYRKYKNRKNECGNCSALVTYFSIRKNFALSMAITDAKYCSQMMNCS